jgi:exodeoxyribonuclease-3
MQKGFAESVLVPDADIICLQETKALEEQANLRLPGYAGYWNSAIRKGYSGTAVFTRREPIAVTYGIDRAEHDSEGRVITLEFSELFVVDVYTPNSRDGLVRLNYRMLWEDAFREYLLTLDKQKPVIICGDLNVAHNEIDLSHPKENYGNTGFTDEERGKLSRLLESGFVDSFRALHPNTPNAYSWWSYRTRARERNIGWRIDYCVLSERLLPKLRDASIHAEITGSDHCPVELIIDSE